MRLPDYIVVVVVVCLRTTGINNTKPKKDKHRIGKCWTSQVHRAQSSRCVFLSVLFVRLFMHAGSLRKCQRDQTELHVRDLLVYLHDIGCLAATGSYTWNTRSGCARATLGFAEEYITSTTRARIFRVVFLFGINANTMHAYVHAHGTGLFHPCCNMSLSKSHLHMQIHRRYVFTYLLSYLPLYLHKYIHNYTHSYLHT